MAVSTISHASEWVVYERANAIWKIKSDGSAAPQQLTFPAPQFDTHASVCSGGHRIVFERNGDIQKITQNGGPPVNLTPDTYSNTDPDCGTDGETNYVVFQSNREPGGNGIYRMNLANGNTVLLIENGAQPAFCGTNRVVFMRFDGLDQDVFTMDLVDGGNVVQHTFNGDTEEFPACRPDGVLIAFTRYFINPTHKDIMEIKINDLEYEKHLTGVVTNQNDYFPVYSPDGTHIAFTRINASIINPVTNRIFTQLAQPGETAEELTHEDNTAFPDWAELAP